MLSTIVTVGLDVGFVVSSSGRDVGEVSGLWLAVVTHVDVVGHDPGITLWKFFPKHIAVHKLGYLRMLLELP